MRRIVSKALLNEFTQNKSLIKHALGVEAAMRHYAKLLGEDEYTWGVVGLIHDFDYERWPEPPQHTREGVPRAADRACRGRAYRLLGRSDSCRTSAYTSSVPISPAHTA